MVGKKQDKQPSRKGTGWLNIARSTIAAACGVQTDANRQRDFQQGSPVTFIVAGLVFVLLFVLGMYGVVQLVLSLSAQGG